MMRPDTQSPSWRAVEDWLDATGEVLIHDLESPLLDFPKTQFLRGQVKLIKRLKAWAVETEEIDDGQ